MPRWKYAANRFLTGLQNRVYDLQLSEYHTGFRAYSGKLLETIDYRANSNDFVFDQELVGQVVRAGFRIAEVPVPTRYFAEASSVNFRRSVVYGLSTLRTLVGHRREQPGPGREPSAEADPADVVGGGGARRDLAAGC
jgi:hypothetical protein